MTHQQSLSTTEMPIANSKQLIVLICAMLLSACAVAPKKLDGQNSDNHGSFIRLVKTENQMVFPYAPKDQQLNRAITESNNTDTKNLDMQRFSRGDLLNLRIQSMDNYDGLYQINTNGQLELPIDEPIDAAGLTRAQLISAIQSTLHRKGWFPDQKTLLDVSLVRAAAIDITVHGAVFEQGQFTINGQPASKQEDAIQQQAGSHADDRNLVAAIRAAGGVRPDANLQDITLLRNGIRHSINLHNLFSGHSFDPAPSLSHGDQIYIATHGKEDAALIRPSKITPPGMRILMSNLTAPSLSNALSAVGADSTRLHYGASLLDGALSANCVGGTHQANASRTVLLVTRHYGSKEQLIVKRTVNQLLAASSQHSVNPFLMPNDGIACYDSRFTNIRDVARGIGEIFGPLIFRGLL